MRLVTTDAIVLRSYNLAESDRIVVCLTRSSGLVRAVAKGARRMKSRFGAALEPFTLIKLSFHERENRDLVTMSAAEILKSHFNLSSNFDTAEVLAYMGELVTEFAPPHETDERLFRMLTACVEALADQSGSERALTRYFEIWLLRLAGLFPDFRACALCGVCRRLPRVRARARPTLGSGLLLRAGLLHLSAARAGDPPPARWPRSCFLLDARAARSP